MTGTNETPQTVTHITADELLEISLLAKNLNKLSETLRDRGSIISFDVIVNDINDERLGYLTDRFSSVGNFSFVAELEK